MYYHRNRPKYSPEELAEVYSQTYDHERWPDHIARVERTIEVGKDIFLSQITKDPIKVADLSCGDGAILDGLFDADHRVWPIKGDLVAGYHYTGPIEETILMIPHVDLFILSETLEHLDDPEQVLREIRMSSERLLLTTPKLSWPDPNPEHYHSWDDEYVRALLTVTGWDPDDYFYTEQYTGLGYTYQIWGCR